MYTVLVKTNHRPIKAYGPFLDLDHANAWKNHHNRITEGRREYTVVALTFPLNPDHATSTAYNPLTRHGDL